MAEDPKKPKGEGPLPDPEDIEEIGEGMDESAKKTVSFTDNIKGAAGGISSLSNSAQGFFSMFGGGLDLSIAGIISFALKIDTARAEMDKATGAAGKLSGAVRESRKHVKGLGANFEFLTQATAATYEGMSAFSNLSSEVQGRMAGLAAGLTRVGVDAGTTAKNFDIMNKGLGLSVEQTEAMTKSIMRTAIGLGTTPKKMAADFAASAPILARYGKNTEGVFRKLAAQSKATGAEMSSLLGVAGKFDTFEDAAGTTAQLNALLGTQLNSVDMLTASEGERIEMMKQSIESSGKSWESMDRFERKALAGAVGMTDLAEAGKIFGTSLEDMEDAEAAADPALTAQEELNKAMKKGTSMQDAWNAMIEGIMAKLSNAVMPLVMEFMNWLVTPGADASKSPLGIGVDLIVEFADYVKSLVKDWKAADGDISKSIKSWAPLFVGVIIAAGPILGFFGTLIGLVSTVWTVITSVLGAVKSLWGAFVIAKGFIMPVITGIAFALGIPVWAVGLIIAAIVGLIAVVWIFRDEIAEAIQVAWDFWVGFAEAIPGAIGGAIDWVMSKLSAFGSWMGALFGQLGDGLRLVFQGIGNFFVGMLNDWIVKPLNGLIGWAYDLITNLPDWAVPDVFQNASREDFLIEPFERFHDGTEEGRPMLGPAIVEDNETVILPSKNSAGGTVLTANDMANAGTGNQPVTVVINIDGREFVRQTVIPVLNKEFSLQGI